MSGGGDRLLSCLLPQGLGAELQARLFSELGLTQVEVHSTRGFIGSNHRGLFNCVEKEILTAITAADQADDLFEWIYHAGKVADMEGRFLYMVPLDRSTQFELPADVPPEGE